MDKKAFESLIRHLLPFGGTRKGSSESCPSDEMLAALEEGRLKSGSELRAIIRHIKHCPDCLEHFLLLRRLTGKRGALFPDTNHLRLLQNPVWRPLVSAAALILVIGLLYLGGSTLYDLSKPKPLTAHYPLAPGLSTEKRTNDSNLDQHVTAERQKTNERRETAGALPGNKLSAKEEKLSDNMREPESTDNQKATQSASPPRQTFAPEPHRQEPASKDIEQNRGPAKALSAPKAAPARRAARENLPQGFSASNQDQSSLGIGASPQVEAIKQKNMTASSVRHWLSILNELCQAIPSPAFIHNFGGIEFIEANNYLIQKDICAMNPSKLNILRGRDAIQKLNDLQIPTSWKGVFLQGKAGTVDVIDISREAH